MKRIIIASLMLLSGIAKAQTDTSFRTLIVFFDGLRPDYITPAQMPNVYAFQKRGAYGKQHHSVFPTVTRVNASSYATGSYPDHHGIMGNTVFFPIVDPVKGLNTGNAEDLLRIAKATNGQLLTATSLGEALEQVGQSMMVFSSGSSGQALLQNHKVGKGAIVNTSFIEPASLKATLEASLGPIPANKKPNIDQHRWVADALIKFGLPANGPLVNAIWFSDPDGAAHSDGIGSPAAVASIRSVDEQFGRIIAAIEQLSLTNRMNVIISTDHGFVTYKGKMNLTELLISKGLKKAKDSDDVVVAEGAIYVKGHDTSIIKQIVALLQQEEWIGAIFTKALKPESMQGWVPGTFSFDAIHWNHPTRVADILVDKNWTDERNAQGYAGYSYSTGVAGHGSLSPYEVHIPLLVAGPSFKKAYESELPTSNTDIAATVLYLHRIPAPSTMQGRVVMELLKDKKTNLPKPKHEQLKQEAKLPSGTYRLTLDITHLGNYRYINFAKTTRTQ
jgi:arylsulfatase A-like enzyme